MAIVSLKKVKEVVDNSRKTHIIDLGKLLDASLSGVKIPIRVKSFEETLDIKSKVKIESEKLTIEYKPFVRMPKQLRDEYMKDPKFRKGTTETTYFQLCKHSEDKEKIEMNKYRLRLFNILVHIDMDYEISEGVTMWEDAGINKGDYNALLKLFSGIIKHEQHLDILDIILDKLKSGITDENILVATIFNYNVTRAIESIEDETTKQECIDRYNEEVQKAIEKGRKELEEKEKEEVGK